MNRHARVFLHLCLILLGAFAGAAPVVPNKAAAADPRKAALALPKAGPRPTGTRTPGTAQKSGTRTTAKPGAGTTPRPAATRPATTRPDTTRPDNTRKVALEAPTIRYVLSVDTGGAELRAVFGRRTFRFNSEGRTLLELDDLLDPGANAVRLGWTGVRTRAAFTFIRLDGNRAQVLFRYTLDGALRPTDGVLTVAVVRNDEPQGAASLSAFVAKGLVRVTLNGRGLGDYASFERRDITPFLREGRNIIKVQWSKDFGSSLPRGQVTLQAGNRELVRWDGRYIPTMSGEQTIAFVYF